MTEKTCIFFDPLIKHFGKAGYLSENLATLTAAISDCPLSCVKGKKIGCMSFGEPAQIANCSYVSSELQRLTLPDQIPTFVEVLKEAGRNIPKPPKENTCHPYRIIRLGLGAQIDSLQ